MEKAQDYSFNKAHAACYALISYRTAWLRAHHPCEYMAALISSVMNTKDRVPVLRQRLPRARDRGAAARRERVADRLRRRRRQDPLRAERGQGRRRARVPHDHPRARGGRPVRVDLGLHRARRPSVVNKRALESLVKCGALPGSRMGMLQVLEQALAYGQKQQADRLAGQGSIFDGEFGAPEASPGFKRITRPSRPRSSRSPTCSGSRRRRSGSTSPSTRSRRCAPSCARRPTRRSPSSSAAATARSSRSAGSSARSSR